MKRNSPVGWILQTTSQDGRESNEVPFDAVIVALPAKPAATLLQPISPAIGKELAAIPYADSAVVAMLVDRREVDPNQLCFGIVIPQVENRHVLAISFTSEKYPKRTPPDKLLLRVFLGGAVRAELFGESDEKLVELAWSETQSLLGLQTFPSWHRVVRWPSAMPQYLVGHLQRVERIEKELQTIPGLAVAGNAYRGVGIPQCVRSGKRAAEQVIEYLKN